MTGPSQPTAAPGAAPAAPGASLNAARRARELAELAESAGSARGSAPVVDVLVIGGGVTGAGIALDAAARGLSVVLAEKHDLAFGTSRWSSKLVHGGLRYLASGSVGIARESAVERGILLERTAPHLVHALPQIVPLLPGTKPAGAALVRAGFLAGDLLRVTAGTSSATLPRSRRLAPAEVLRYAPTVRSAGLRGGLVFWDGQLVDDARLVVALARTAAAHGARILTRCAVREAHGTGARLTDELTGESFELRARAVVNAAGVWAGELAPGLTLRPSRGTHLVLPQSAFTGPTGALNAGLTVPVPGESNRFVFALPAPDGRVYVGLTDEDAPGPVPDVPQPAEAEIDFLLRTINSALHSPLSRADLLGTFAGLRPLLDDGTGRTADVSRKHAVLTGPDGLVTVVGGKLTTYRRMAEDALDAALARAALTARPCRTRTLPLVGAAPRARLADLPAPLRLVRRYGTEAPAVLAEAGADPALLAPIAPGTETTMAELLFAVRHEGALDADDLLDRRTRIGLAPAHRAAARSAAERALAR
ncbi:glycerol-3-phosphate dehydrogenase/oxidase [Kitasatospora sp. NBC_01287]|uniref:glycerol-3-phosphate dehydrogenase/oxidase n=1 Tax=Kitasatospora sp. NBC_01287 TaxID=2903573 RepID=UPI002252D844|nr:glycerol-3-phosphate dehydrogenase/oxidase [Kitasatospora sp. NBC_01287]MCX4745608.1 glycerol-3-phosphate dehydrogenase/oxidase [Kitasatospora sp. NBC_01287]